MVKGIRTSEQIDSPQDTDISRRDFLQIAWVTTGAITALAIGGISFRFFAPRVVDGEFGGVFTVGQVDEFPLGSVTPVSEGRFYIVRLEDGGFLALYQKCTHLGCAVPWNPEQGRFICPCHASAFEIDGAVINAPAPRPLDRFQISIEDGVIKVDTGKTIQRDQINNTDAIYAVEITHG